MKQRLLRWILVLGMLHGSSSVVYAENMNLIYDGKSHAYSSKAIHVYIDGQEIVTTVMPPVQINNSILVPAREVFETMGASVEWRPSEQSVYIYNEEILIVLQINSYEAWVNGEIRSLYTPAKMINDKVMIPLRFISESLGYTVTWSQSDFSAYIEIPKKIVEDQNMGNYDKEDMDETENTVEDSENNLPTDETIGDIPNFEPINPIIPDMNIGISFNNELVSYDDLSSTFTLGGEMGIQSSQITYEENPHTKQITINLNGDYSQYLEDRSFTVNGTRVKQVDIINQNGQTSIVITTHTISALIVTALNENVTMQVVKPSDKYSKIVVLDAGHGNQDSGTTYQGIKEKDINLRVSNELRNLLEADPMIKVYTIRDDDSFLELQERVQFSNEIEPDLYISMHVNSVVGNNSASGTETYYTVDPDTRNKTFATMVQEALVQEFGTRNRGVKTAKFVVIRDTDAPAILIEIGFLTNESDRIMMTSSGFESRYARTVYQCILNYYATGLHNQ